MTQSLCRSANNFICVKINYQGNYNNILISNLPMPVELSLLRNIPPL